MSKRSWWIWVLLLGGMYGILAEFTLAQDAIRESLAYCARVLIPGLFPFVVLSRFFCRVLPQDGYSDLVKRLPVNKKYISCVLFGWIGGFPNGAMLVSQMSKHGERAMRAVFISSCAGAGFVIGVVGSIVCNDLIFGVCLYVAQILITLFLACFIPPDRTITDNEEGSEVNEAVSRATIFVLAVKDSAIAMLYICAFSVTFSLLSDILAIYIPLPGIKEMLRAIFEFSSGGPMAFHALPLPIGAFLLGFSVGFGGLSVHAQIVSFSADNMGGYGKFLLLKAIVGILCGIFSSVYLSVGRSFGVFILMVDVLIVLLAKIIDIRAKNCKKCVDG